MSSSNLPGKSWAASFDLKNRITTCGPINIVFLITGTCKIVCLVTWFVCRF